MSPDEPRWLLRSWSDLTECDRRSQTQCNPDIPNIGAGLFARDERIN